MKKLSDRIKDDEIDYNCNDEPCDIYVGIGIAEERLLPEIELLEKHNEILKETNKKILLNNHKMRSISLKYNIDFEGAMKKLLKQIIKEDKDVQRN